MRLVLLGFVLTSQLTASAQSPILIVAGTNPVVIELSATQGVQQLPTAWNSFLNYWFDHFDQDHDGKLNPVEHHGVPALLNPMGQSIRFENTSGDLNQDGLVDRDEFSRWYAVHHVTAFQLVAPTNDEAAIQLGRTLWQLLDQDLDEALSPAELAASPQLLHRWDTNEDECLTPNELMARQSSVRLPENPLRWSNESDNVSSPIQISLTLDSLGDSSPRPTVVTSPRETQDCGGQRFQMRIPDGTVTLELRDSSTERIVSARKFLLADIRSALGGKSTVTPADIRANPTLEWMLPFMSGADSHRDQQLDDAEMASIVDLLADGAAAQLSIQVANRGRNLFDVLDRNADGKLELRELLAARDRVLHLIDEHRDRSNGLITADRIPISFVIIGTRGPHANRLSRLRLPKRAPEPKSQPRLANIPRWFEAMDRNADQLLSPAEFLGTAQQFQSLDRNRDSVISMDEVTSE